MMLRFTEYPLWLKKLLKNSQILINLVGEKEPIVE